MRQLLLVLLTFVFLLIVKNNTIEGIFTCSTSDDCWDWYTDGFPFRHPTCCKSSPTQKGICDSDITHAYGVCKGPGYGGLYPNGINPSN